jgi:DNA-directed RNA polymerase specialized sigma subunit
LTEEEREFLELWEGVFGELKQVEIAEVFGVSNSKVTQIKENALDKLRECMEAKGYAE